MRRLLATLLVGAVTASLAAGTTPAHAEDPEDLTPPVLHITPMAGRVDGWYGGTATVFVKATDPGAISSGVRFVSYTMTGATTGTGTVNRTDGGTLTISNGGMTTINFEAEDGNGNQAFGVTQMGIDRDRPTAAFTARLAEAEPVFAQGEQVTVGFSCADALSGVGSCTGTQAAGAALDTTELGDHVVVVTARDRVGNQTQINKQYRVISNQFSVTQGADITGMTVVGRQVGVQAPVFDPVPTAVAYQWTRNGTAIPGATGTTYTLTPDDARTTLALRATATRSGWQDRTIVSPGYQVLPAAITVSSEPVLTGTARVGNGLRVDHGTVTPTAAAISYQWLRDGVLVPAATGRIYNLGAEDMGKRIAVRVAATAPGHAEAVWLTAPSDVVVGRKLDVTGVPTVSGVMRAGSVLTAQPPTVREPVENRPGDPASVAYQWLRGGTPIAGATQATYRLSAEDVGRQVTVRITATRPPAEGYEPVVLTSSPGPAVVKATPEVTGKAKAKGKRKVKLTVAVSVPGLDPSAPVTVKRGSKVVGKGTMTSAGQLVLILKRQPKGKVSWTVLYAGSQGVEARTFRVSAKVR
jgi:hypothetical protein